MMFMVTCGDGIKQLALFFVLVSVLFPVTRAGAEPSGDPRQGPAFSSPDKLAPVPEGWSALPLQREPADRDADLVVALGQQSWPLLHEVVAEYGRSKNLNIAVKQGSCGITAGRLLKKSVDIGAYCCPPGENDRLPGVEFHSLGISPIALIVHPDNPLTDVTTEQAREIFQGSVNRWTELDTPETGKLDRLVQPVGRLHCKIRPGHWRLLLGNEDQFSPRLFEVGVIPDMISQVARNPGAIGLEVPSMTTYHRAKGEVRMLKIDGHEATDLAYVRSGKYPLFRTYHLTVWKQDSKANRLARELVAYLQAHVEKIRHDISFVSPSELRAAGWRFRGDELIGRPDGSGLAEH
ncbi:hypothetical protein MNBD_GAMMA13-1224 [hydrothermal vent metagenome]|uniref:PBP domain-containing protein n=1 Tax=hydrothermal vent metagenome TaxID=652676 RepID=A0A3B0YM50_9ZZZZ